MPGDSPGIQMLQAQLKFGGVNATKAPSEIHYTLTQKRSGQGERLDRRDEAIVRNRRRIKVLTQQ